MAASAEGGSIVLSVGPAIGLRHYVMNVNIHFVAASKAAAPICTIPYGLLQFLSEGHSIFTYRKVHSLPSDKVPPS